MSKKPEVAVDLSDNWKTKGRSPRNYNTFERIFLPGSTVSRDPEEGCMPKVKLERTIKLRDEEQKGKRFNIINGQDEGQSKWIKAYG